MSLRVLGPSGIGVLWGRYDLLEAVQDELRRRRFGELDYAPGVEFVRGLQASDVIVLPLPSSLTTRCLRRSSRAGSRTKPR